MIETIVNSEDKPKATPEALMEYSREIAPMLRDLLKQKELLKDFKESDDTALDLAQAIKDAQDELKAYIEKDEDAKGFLDRIKEIESDIKEAVTAAAKVCEFKPAELKAFFLARVKDTVEKTVDKGHAFAALEELLK